MAGDLEPGGSGEFILYQAADGTTRIQVRVENETVWLSQRDMAELFQTTPQNKPFTSHRFTRKAS